MGDVGVFQSAADANDTVDVDERIQFPHLLIFYDEVMTAFWFKDFSQLQLFEDVGIMMPLH